MQQVRIVKKYVTTDGMEFLSLESANEYQLRIDSIGESLSVGMKVKFCDKTMQGAFIQRGVIDSIELPFITFSLSERSTQEHYFPNIIIVPDKQA